MKKINKISALIEKTEHYSFTVRSSRDGQEFLKLVWPSQLQRQEAFVCLFLNRMNRVLNYSVISIGGVAGTIADSKIIFQDALACNASNLILVHNHPSGEIKPSKEDQELTKKIAGGAKLLDMKVLDHLIISETTDYYSFADNGLL